MSFPFSIAMASKKIVNAYLLCCLGMFADPIFFLAG